MSEYKIEDGHTLHLVKSGPKSTTGPSATPAPAAQPITQAAVQPQVPQVPQQPQNPTIPLLPPLGGAMNPMGQMMETLLQNPAFLESMIQSNPMFQQMGMNGEQLRQMLSSPGIAQMMSNPALMQMATNPQLMQQMMGGGMPGMPGGAMGQPQPPAGMLQNPFATALFGGGLPGAMPTATPAAGTANAQPPEIRFQQQLQQLQDMGFYDAQMNLRALQMTNGNVNAAVEFLLRSLT